MREVTPRSWPAFVVIGIVLLYAFVMLIVPFATVIYSALRDGLQAVVDTFTDANLQHALLVTLVLTVIAVSVNALFGLITAWVLVRQRFRGRKLFDLLVDVPFVFATPIAGFAVLILFGREGWFSPTFVPIVFAYPAIVLVKIFVALPFVTREVQPVLESLSPEPEDAAYTIGANRWTTFRRVLLPEIWTALLYGIVLTFARTVGEFGAVSVVGGALEGYTESATTFIFRALKDRNDTAAYSVSLLLCALSVIILLVMSRLRTRIAHRA
ncbi:MAG: sulfate ABC transporter permease subunit [bacterium]|nr:sulfate ABC transporter permease subunit [bacterium]